MARVFSWVLPRFTPFTMTQSWKCWNYCQLCIPIFLQFSSPVVPTDISKCEIRNQGIYENYISWIQSLLDELILNGTAKTKLAMLAFLYCEGIVKNSIGLTQYAPCIWIATHGRRDTTEHTTFCRSIATSSQSVTR